MALVDKTITIPDATQGLTRGFRGIHQGENQFGRFHKLLAARLNSFTAMAAAMWLIQDVLHEISTNCKAFCTQRGVSEKELEECPESTAYGAYVMGIGVGSGAVELDMARAACLVGCGEVGRLWLADGSEHPGGRTLACGGSGGTLALPVCSRWF